MSSETATIGALKRVAAALFAATILATAPLSVAFAAAPKAGKPAASAKSEATPEKIQELMTLLADPKVRDWLEQESKAEAAQERESDSEANSVSHEFDTHVAAIREHIVALGAALPDLPDQIETAHSRVSVRARRRRKGQGPAAACRIRWLGLWRRMAVSQGDGEDPPASRRAPARNRQ